MRISNSQIQTFKQCRRLWELRYKYGLQPVQIAPALESGLTYHDKIESIVKTGDFERDGDPKTDAMAMAFKKYVYPFLIDKFEPEVWFEHTTPAGNVVVGRYDGISERLLLEHKSTSSKVDGTYWSALELDEQILTYMMASGKRKVFYTVCKKPDIRQSKNETDEDFAERCERWFDNNTDERIGWQIISRTDEELNSFEGSIDEICKEISGCTNFYRNQTHCMRWGRPCEFLPICKNYDPEQTYIGFERREAK